MRTYKLDVSKNETLIVQMISNVYIAAMTLIFKFIKPAHHKFSQQCEAEK